MNTYYTKHPVNDTYTPTTISVDDAIAALIQSAVTNAVNKVNDIIINAVTGRVSAVVDEANIKSKIDEHLGTINIADIVDDHVDQAVRDYDYGSIVEEAAGDVNIEEIVEEKVRDHLDSCCIQVRIS